VFSFKRVLKKEKTETLFQVFSVNITGKVENRAEIDEQELAILCAKKDKSAMKELYTRYAARLTVLCTRYSDSPEDGLDLMHDTMCKVLDSIGKYQHRRNGSLYAWICRIAVHLAIDRSRKDKKWKISSLEDNYFDIVEYDQPEIEAIPEEVLLSFISQLSITRRSVFNLFCIEGTPHKEIAERLGISEAASRSTLSKAKKDLADMIKRYLNKNE